MKIIHCADLHLDSKMTANLSKEQAKERKMEILRTFSRMVDYAAKNGVKVIIIAGDLFDTRNVSATARNLVRDTILKHPHIDFLYLKIFRNNIYQFINLTGNLLRCHSLYICSFNCIFVFKQLMINRFIIADV